MRIAKWLFVFLLITATHELCASDTILEPIITSRGSSPINATPPKVRDSHKVLRAYLRYKNVEKLQEFNNLVLTFSEGEKGALRQELLKEVTKEIETCILKFESSWTENGFKVNGDLFRNIILYCSLIQPECSTKWAGVDNFITICELYMRYYPDDVQIYQAINIIKIAYEKHLAVKINQDNKRWFSNLKLNPNTEKQVMRFIKAEGILFVTATLLVGYIIYTL